MDADEGDEQPGERDRKRDYPAPDRRGHGGTISRSSLVCQGVWKTSRFGVRGSIPRRDKADSGNGERGQPFLAHDAER